jgi:iron complex transport system ATP-binding protein
MLTARDIYYDYSGHQVLRGVSLSLAPGEVLAVLGQNGAGKSTLLRCLAGAIQPKGQVELDGRPLCSVPPGERARLLAFVPQHVPPRLPMTVFETVLLGRRPYLSWRPRPQDLEVAWGALSLLGLEELAHREFSEISGGQRQKAALARALAQESRLLVMDEPTSSLDLRHQLEVMTLLCAQAEERDTGVILAVHDLNLAARFAHRAILLSGGRVEADGPPSEVLTEESIRRVYGVEVLRLEAGAGTMFFPMSAVGGNA